MFIVGLDSKPSASVTVGAESSDVGEGFVSSPFVTFAVGNWDVSQTVTVTGSNDVLVDGNISYHITTGEAISSDTNFHGNYVAGSVGITNTDGRCNSSKDRLLAYVPAIRPEIAWFCAVSQSSLHPRLCVVMADDRATATVAPTSGLFTTEAGGTAVFTMALDAQPSFQVTVMTESTMRNEGIPSWVTFSVGNWNIYQSVTVTGRNDARVDANMAYIITATAASSDSNFHGTTVVDAVGVTNMDGNMRIWNA